MKKRDLKMLALLGLASGLLLANQAELEAVENDGLMEQGFLSSLSQEDQQLFRSLDQSGQLLAKLIASPSVGESDANNWNSRFGAGCASDCGGGGGNQGGGNLFGGSCGGGCGGGNQGGGYGSSCGGASNGGGYGGSCGAQDNGYGGSCGSQGGCGTKGGKGDSGAKGVGGAKGPSNQGKSNAGKSNASSKNNAKPGQVSLGETPSSGRGQVSNRGGNNNHGKNNQGKNSSNNNGNVSLNDSPTSRGNAGKQGFNAGRPISNSTAGANQGNKGNSGKAGDSTNSNNPGWRNSTPAGQVSFGENQSAAPQAKFRPAVNRGYTAEDANAATNARRNAASNAVKENTESHNSKNNAKGNAGKSNAGKNNAGKGNAGKANSKNNKGNLSFNTEEQPAHTAIDRDLLVSLLNKPTRAQFLRLSEEGQNLALELANQSCKNQNKCDGKNSCQSDANDCAGQGHRGTSPGPFTDKNLAVRVAAMHDKRATAGN